MDWGIFKRHPKATAIGAVVVILVVLVIKKMGGNSSGNVSGSSTNQYDAQIAQLSAAASAQQTQAQAQLQAAQIQAGVQTAAITAQQDIANQQSQAQLDAVKTQYTSELAAVQDQDKTKISLGSQYFSTQDKAIAAQVQEQTDVLTYLTKQSNNQAQISRDTLAHVRDVNGSQNRTAIILSSTGNVPGSVAAENGQTISSISGDTFLSNIAKGAATVASALFA